MAHPSTGNYERADFSGTGVVWFTVGLIVMVCVCALVVGFIAHYWEFVYPSGLERRLSTGLEGVPGPQLQSSPPADYQRIHARELETLATYGWVDHKAGVVHIPIEQAMAMVLERGLPVRTGTAATVALPPTKRKFELPPPVQRLGTVGNP